MLASLLLASSLAGSIQDVSVSSIQVDAMLEPAAHLLRATARFDVDGVGELVLQLNDRAEVKAVIAGNEETLFVRTPDAADGIGTLTINLAGGEGTLTVLYEAVFEQDAQAGEVAGQIHNFSVNAHIGEDGVFLSDGSAWHPQPIDSEGVPVLIEASINLAPIEGWAFVASGDPAAHLESINDPVWNWRTPRPVDGIALSGNHHVLHGRLHPTKHGEVEVVMQLPEAHAELAPLFVDAACEYLDLYVPMLGEFPYKRFTIVENFFSSGFAMPGFTLLGPRVVMMGERSLAPGYLDHELLHNWWGNGVYVDPADGNWCEALTSYCANYYRRVAEDGEEAGRDYRRGILMKLSTDPEGLDDGPLDRFGRPGGPGRFVGYDKGSFVFMMLEHGPGIPDEKTHRVHLWLALRRFAAEYMGKRAGWDDLQRVIEATYEESRSGFFDHWVHGHPVPRSPATFDPGVFGEFSSQYTGDELIDVGVGADENGRWYELDPQFLVYRVLLPGQIIPTIGGTFGVGGVRPVSNEERAEVESYLPRIPPSGAESAENLLLIGAAAIAEHAELIAGTGDPIVINDDGSFTVAGGTHGEAGMAVLHTMAHPDKPGRFITVFFSVGDAGWSRLRLIGFYTRDTTIVWDGGEVVGRRVFEPSRKLRRE